MKRIASLLMACCIASASLAATNPRLTIPEFPGLAERASESVVITLDPELLGMAARFLNGKDPQDAATQDIIKGLRGVYVRSYTFDHDAGYQPSDLADLRAQLSAPGWNRVLQTKSSKSLANVEVYIMMANDKPQGLALIAIEPREFTIVNIVGEIDLEKLRKLEGQFGIPRLDVDAKGASTPK